MEKGTIVAHTGVEVPVYGKYKSNVFFGSFDVKDMTNIRIFAQECQYILEPDPDKECRCIKIYNNKLEKWGWVKKLWTIDPETEKGYPDYVYGFWQGKHFSVKYSIFPQMRNLNDMHTAILAKKKVVRAVRMKKIFIPDLESDPKLKEIWKKIKK